LDASRDLLARARKKVDEGGYEAFSGDPRGRGGCHSGGLRRKFLENRVLNLGVATGWDENQVVANLTKILLEEELGYGEVRRTELELGPVFEGVRSGDLDAFQDMWLPNHQAQLSKVENNVVQLSPWYQGQTEFGIGVPTYMTNVNAIPI
jgi:glycine betaine/proline transport system substrate-binding protein